MTYAEKLKDPRWQRKRLEVLERNGFTCEHCKATDMTLHVHHRYYVSGRMPWEYPDFCFQCLCWQCHGQIQDFQEMQREGGKVQFEDWEVGLDHFGNSVIGLALDDIESNR